MKIYKNFLSKKDFKSIESIILGDQMPWYFNNDIIGKKTKSFQFTFLFIKNSKNNCNSDMLNILSPIFSKLNFSKINIVKANLLTRDEKIIEHGYHIDQNKGKTGILYMNTCNGYTKFETGKVIKSEKNKFVEFDSNIKHTGSSCTDKKRRIVINFNYT